MKLQEGPAFGALIIGGGVGYLVLQKYQSLPLALGAGFVVGAVDYFMLVWIKKKSGR